MSIDVLVGAAPPLFLVHVEAGDTINYHSSVLEKSAQGTGGKLP